MKLSEAILLGSTVVAPKAGALRFSDADAGCALGMAAIATGCTFVRPLRQIPAKDLRTVNSEDIWGTWLLRVVMRPCSCDASLSRALRIKDIIAHLFDDHVMANQDWTLDQLVKWVEQWEPKEPDQASLNINPLGRFFPSPDLHTQAKEWQATRDAFEKKQQPKRERRPPRR